VSNVPTMKIVEAHSTAQIDMARSLFLEYEKEINVDLCFQGFAEELKTLPGKYGRPDGVLLLAMEGEHAIGCVALRRISSTNAEMKRLYVRPTHRHLKLGRELARQIVERARDVGYRRMVLDTLANMLSAQALYRSLGFVPTAPYYDNPLPGVMYFAKDFSSS
jgi:putative acetyltransferase